MKISIHRYVNILVLAISVKKHVVYSIDTKIGSSF